jgi:hypothetical protein
VIKNQKIEEKNHIDLIFFSEELGGASGPELQRPLVDLLVEVGCSAPPEAINVKV